jgi:hypothetical protein
VVVVPMSDEISAVYGVVSQVRDYPSQQVSRVVVEVPIEHHVSVTQLLYGAKVLITLAPEALGDRPYGLLGPPPQPRRPKGGPLSELAGQWCRDPRFHRWVRAQFPDVARALPDSTPGETLCREAILTVCGITSRRELDHDASAKGDFDRLFRRPFMSAVGNNDE